MAISSQDLNKGLDFTGLGASATAGDHNNLVDAAAPVLDSASEGKGLIVWTKDSALNTPIVPDAATTTKWKRYIWLRIPHSTATSDNPTVYSWNDNAVSVATYLKWLQVSSDLTAIQAQIDAIIADVATATGIADGAVATASAANIAAGTALNTANAAKGTADGAAANAETARLAAINAQTTADSAYARAGLALENAATATGIANTALTNVTNLTTVVNNSVIQFTSEEYAPVQGPVVNVIHGLGGLPTYLRWVLVCKSDELGYITGDEIDIVATVSNVSANYQTYLFGASYTNIFLIINGTLGVPPNIFILHKTTGNPTGIDTDKWKFKGYAKR